MNATDRTLSVTVWNPTKLRSIPRAEPPARAQDRDQQRTGRHRVGYSADIITGVWVDYMREALRMDDF